MLHTYINCFKKKPKGTFIQKGGTPPPPPEYFEGVWETFAPDMLCSPFPLNKVDLGI